MQRVIFFIDGFNLYYSIRSNPILKWLNLKKLCECFITKDDDIKDIYYFTAYPTRDFNRYKRHQNYIRALRTEKIKVVFGEYKSKMRFCAKCKTSVPVFEEKLTDVNIAIQMICLGYQNKFDKAIVISGDTDLLPAIDAVRHLFHDKKVGVILPSKRVSEALKVNSDFYMKIKSHHLNASLFPFEIDTCDGKTIACPLEWR